jgi:hypothetical protein
MSEETEEKEVELEGKERAFVEAYFGAARFNGTEAARMAKFKGNRNVLAVTASRLLRKAKIKEYVDERFAILQMPANEVLTRLTEIGRGNISDFLSEGGSFDLLQAKKRGVDHLLKKLKQKRTLKQKKTEVTENMRGFLADDEIEDIETETEIIYEEIEFELYSAHEALRDLGKYHKLFTDKVEHGGTIQTVGMTIDEFKQQAAERLNKANETLDKFNGK